MTRRCPGAFATNSRTVPGATHGIRAIGVLLDLSGVDFRDVGFEVTPKPLNP